MLAPATPDDTGPMTVLRRFRVIDPGRWPPRQNGKPRVLIEHPDRAVLWEAARALRGEGYEVRVCAGPDDGERCPLTEFGSCLLVEEADVVVTSTRLADADGLLETYSQRDGPRLVVEARSSEFEEIAERLPGAVFVPRPFDERSLRAAVGRAEARSG
jgi:DNA-binding response OmpR family regulator